MSTAVSFRDVDIIFGRRTKEALELLDRGESRGSILDKTGAVLGVAGASLDVGTSRPNSLAAAVGRLIGKAGD